MSALAAKNLDYVVLKEQNQAIDSSADFEDRIIKGYISTIDLDRDGEAVPVEAFKQDLHEYMQNPILLLHHHHKSLPVGRALRVTPRKDGLWGEFYISKTKVGDEVLTLIKEKCLRGFSTGFVPIEYIENPPAWKLPDHIKEQSKEKQKKVRKIYNRVELVEVSLLAIPSNRRSLISYAQKGNKVADLVVKMFDIEEKQDISDVVDQWISETKSKGIFDWDESEHPRASDGKFAPKAEGEVVEEKLDKIISDQEAIHRSLKIIEDKDSWKNWAKKWGIRIVGAIGGYYGFKRLRTLESWKLFKGKAKNHFYKWLQNRFKDVMSAKSGHLYVVTKGEEDNLAEAQRFTDHLEQIEQVLAKGKELGMDKSKEYKKIKREYDATIAKLIQAFPDSKHKGIADLFLVSKGERERFADGRYRNDTTKPKPKPTKDIEEDIVNKGLAGLYRTSMADKGLAQLYTVTKEAEFKEEEHPRHEDGKFRPKGSAAKGTTKNNKPKSAIKIAVGATAITGAGVFLSHKGIQIYKTAQVVKRFADRNKVKIAVDNIKSACSNPHPNGKSVENIVNMSVEDNLSNKIILSENEQKVVDYVANTEQFQKDLSKTFGHLEVGGTTQIDIRNGYSEISQQIKMLAANIEVHKDVEKTNKLLKYFVGYDPVSNRISVNTTILNSMARKSKDSVFTDPYKILVHEYTHSITTKHDDIAKRHIKGYLDKARTCIGKEVDFQTISFVSDTHFKGKIVDVKLSEMTRSGKVFSETFQDVPKKIKDSLDKTPYRELVFKIKTTDGTIFLNSKELSQTYAVSKMPFGPRFKFGELSDEREIYSLTNLDEWCAVLVERGGKL